MLGNFRKNRAAFPVRARQIADAHKEFADDFAAHEFEVLAEQLDPFVLIAGAVRLDPIGKAAVALADAGFFRAFSTVASILRRLRMIDASLMRRSISWLSKPATRSTLKFSKAILKPSRFFKTISQESPA